MKRIELPDGSVAEFPAEMDDAAIEQVLKQQYRPPGGMSQQAQSFRIGGGGEAPGILEQLAGGAKHGFDRLAYGVKGLVTDLSPEDRALLEQGRSFVKETGPASTVGQIGAEVGLTWPVGSAIGGAGKVLSKAVPALGKVANWGGRVFNVGLVGRGAAEGAAQAGLTAPDPSSPNRGANMAMGALAGAALPAAGLVGASVRNAKRFVAPPAKMAAARAGQAFESTLGADELAKITRQVQEGLAEGPSRLPRTTAATANSPRLGLLEKISRGSSPAAFDAHDLDVAQKAWNIFQDDTAEAGRSVLHKARQARVQRVAEGMLKESPFTDKARKTLAQELTYLGLSDEALSNPAVARTLNQIGGMLEDPAASPAMMQELIKRLEKTKSPTLQELRGILGSQLDEVSRGAYTKGQTLAAKHGARAAAAEGEAAVRGAFVSPQGTPITPRVVSTPEGNIPKLAEGPLRRAIAKNEGALNPVTRGDLLTTAEELRRHELFNAAQNVGTGGISMDTNKALGLAGLSASGHWGLRAGLNLLYTRADKATRKMMDEALLHPEKFMEVMAAKQASQAPLSIVEQTLLQAVTGTGRAAATPGE